MSVSIRRLRVHIAIDCSCWTASECNLGRRQDEINVKRWPGCSVPKGLEGSCDTAYGESKRCAVKVAAQERMER